MKEVGSKLAVLIIVLVMVFLASLLFDATNDSVYGDNVDESPLLYEDVVELESSLPFPEFDAFEALGEPFTRTPEAVRIESEPLAKNFEDLITRNYEAIGVNFAKQYSIVTWSCGTECQNSAIIDAKDGNIVFYGLLSANGLTFSPSSNLIINNVYPSVGSSTEGVYSKDYYILSEESTLELIAKEIRNQNVLPGCIHATTTARNSITNEVNEFKTPCHVPYGWDIISNR